MNNAAMSICMQISTQIPALSYWSLYPEVEVLHHLKYFYVGWVGLGRVIEGK